MPSSPSRLPPIDLDTDEPALAAIFANVSAATGRVPNLYRTLAHAPELLEAWIAFAWPLRQAAVSDRALRELVILRTAQLTSSDYEWRQHWRMALEVGVSEAKIAGLGQWPDNDTFTDAERAALRMTDELGATAGLSDSSWATLRSHFDERECLELVLTASFYSCVSRVLGGLAVPFEDDTAMLPPVDPDAATPHL